MRDITINSDESQKKKRKTTPVMKSLDGREQLDKSVTNAILQIWQELRYDYRTLIGVTIDKSDVNLPSKISNEEQKNV
ncbi:hypothetical protein KDA11_00780 [Candidatus Saccharibacteria bacterium]|nr:hypothetical protein [Candidatus Saccharibacteria bacterium]